MVYFTFTIRVRRIFKLRHQNKKGRLTTGLGLRILSVGRYPRTVIHELDLGISLLFQEQGDLGSGASFS